MKNKVVKLIDLKSIITIIFVIELVILLNNKIKIDTDLKLLFSNSLTMILTFFFTKDNRKERETDDANKYE